MLKRGMASGQYGLFVADDSESQQPRSAYLRAGRRVTIVDLLDAGLLAVGDAMRFKRPRMGENHRAVVTASGAIALDGGQEFRSPSRAATVAADMKSVDGWHAWTMVTSGRSLDSLRQQLLDQATTGVAEESSGAQARYEWLKEVRTRAEAKKPVEMAVRDLLARWDAKSDGTTLYQRVDADLANHGLYVFTQLPQGVHGHHGPPNNATGGCPG
jgi:hypothetical protein